MIHEDITLADIDRLQEQLKANYVHLPNLMGLSSNGVPGLNESGMWNQLEALRGLAMLRRLFPETIDSIVDVDFFRPGADRGRMFNAARAVRFPTAGHNNAGPLGFLIKDMEPNAPFNSTSRYEARIPLNNIGQIRMHAPNVWAHALTSRLVREAPEFHEQMLDAVMPPENLDRIQRAMRGSSHEHADFIGSSIRPAQLKRRLASLYAPDLGRFSGASYHDRGYSRGDTPPDPVGADEADFREFRATDPRERKGRTMSWTPGHEFFDDFESVARENDLGEAIDRLGGLNSRAYWDNQGGFGPSWHRTAPVARNPTNVKLQQLLNEAIGTGEGQMRGSAHAGTIAGVAGLAALPLVAQLLPQGAQDYLSAALTGGGIGGLPGAVVGAGVKGIKDLLD